MLYDDSVKYSSVASPSTPTTNPKSTPDPLTPMSTIAITLSASIVVFVLLSLAIILFLRFRQKHLIDAFHGTNHNARLAQYPAGHVRVANQSYGDTPQVVFSEKTDSLRPHTRTRPPRPSRTEGPSSWSGSLELQHNPLLGHADGSDGLAAVTTPETAIGNDKEPSSGTTSWTQSLKRGATFPIAQFHRTDPFLTSIAENPVLRSTSSPLLSKTASNTKRRGTPLPAPPGRGHRDSPEIDKTSITEWPSGFLEPLPKSPEKSSRGIGSHARRQSRNSGDCHSLTSIINLAMRGPSTGSNGNSNDDDQRLQRRLPTLSTRGRSPGLVPDSPVPPLAVKINNNDSHDHQDIFTTRRKGFLSRKKAPLTRYPESVSSLQSTSSSILETAKYTASSQPNIIATLSPQPLHSSPPNFSTSPLSSHTSSGPSILDGLVADWGTPPAGGLTSPSVTRLHRKRLSYGASLNSGGRGSTGLRQSVSCGGRIMRAGSLTSLATLGKPEKEDEKEENEFQYPSSSSGGGVSLDTSLPMSNNENSSGHKVDTPPMTVPISPTTPSRKPNGSLNQSQPSHFALSFPTSTPEPPPCPWAANTTPTNNNSDPHSILHWDFRPFPKGPSQHSPTKKGHKRQNCIRINYNPMELSTPQHCTLLSPIASVSDHPTTSTPRTPSSTMAFSPLPAGGHGTIETKRKTRSETPQLETSQSEMDLRDSPTFAMMNYYSCPPSPTCNDDDGLSVRASWSSSASGIFTAPDTDETTPPQLKSLKEPSPPSEHRTYIPFPPSPVPPRPQQTQHLRFSVLALRRMNSDISTSTSRAGGVTRYLNLGGFGAGVGASPTTGAASFASIRTIDDLLQSSSEDQGEPPRKIARVCSGAAVMGRRRRTIGSGKDGDHVEGVVGLGLGGVLE